MNKQKVINTIKRSGLIAVLRLESNENITQIIDALMAGGVELFEITMTIPDAMDIIRELSGRLPAEYLVGVGTVTDAETAESAIAAGAEFVVSPILNTDLIKRVNDLEKVMVAGAFTPTEIHSAWQQGADVVKVFPASTLGPKYCKDIHSPLPHIKLAPTGGVSLDNTADFLKNGACCVGVGSALLNKKMIAEKDWKGLEKLAASFMTAVKKGRS